MAKLSKKELQEVNSFNDLLDVKYGIKGSSLRDEFDAKSKAFQLCELIKEKRKEKGWTQKQLASITGLDKTFISRVEQGKTDVQLSTLLQLLNGLELNLVIK